MRANGRAFLPFKEWLEFAFPLSLLELRMKKRELIFGLGVEDKSEEETSRGKKRKMNESSRRNSMQL